jgi:type VI secretion system protein VasD
MRRRRRPQAFVRTLASSLVLCCLTSACGTRPTHGGVIDKALQFVGLESAETPLDTKAIREAADKFKPATSMSVRVHAGDQLNSTTTGKSLSLVLKIYKLRSYEQFSQLPYEAFTHPQIRNEDVISTREVILLPGQRYEVEEPLSPERAYLGVVALFAAPEGYRWRFVFDAQKSAKQGITLGAHRCALSVSQGTPINTAPESLRLAGSTCR